MKSTMQDVQLTIGSVMRHVTTVHGDTEVVTATADGTRRRTYAEVGRRAARLAHALRGLGIDGDQRVATFMWNNVEHLEAYLAVPSMGAVLHTLNIRLFPEQLVYIANHAEDRVVIVDDSLVPLLAKAAAEARTVTHVIVAGPDAARRGPRPLRAPARRCCSTRTCSPAEPETFDWPEIDERDAAAMCYTSGTTGNPKGVVYSHRSAWLHSLAVSTGNAPALDCHDRVLPIVPMFHANAWGLAYAALMAGASLCMPDRWLQAEPLVRFIQASRPTVSGAVPTVWNDVLAYLDAHEDVRLDSLRLILCGGSAVPVTLQKALQERHGLYIRQAWGMTETSPVASAGLVPVGRRGGGRSGRTAAPRADAVRRRGPDRRRRRRLAPVGRESVGELEVRGTVGHRRLLHPDDADSEGVDQKFHDGWLRTGDVGHLDPLGYITLSDRAKDVIKSGGEWISSVDLENALMGHPDVVEAAVVGIPDEKWQERPLATVVVREGATVDARAAPRPPRPVVREVAAARRVDVHRPGPAHLGRQVRQEGRPAGLRRGPVRRTPGDRLRSTVPDHPPAVSEDRFLPPQPIRAHRHRATTGAGTSPAPHEAPGTAGSGGLARRRFRRCAAPWRVG